MAIKKVSEHFIFTQEQVKLYASITGDNNPLHLDEEFARNTIFKNLLYMECFQLG
ncbi:MAG: hypothetical protein K9N35_01420 [Candidatus Marinimicrobia bacterium]|nr:hypothetical protein [Candidatus Neomarinimicrobiota bacterium]